GQPAEVRGRRLSSPARGSGGRGGRHRARAARAGAAV
ncbi:MAG: hypothetical protein AVDCRST_MAG53-2065, partial [uncultured Solirubrobacteraceae bacterium]